MNPPAIEAVSKVGMKKINHQVTKTRSHKHIVEVFLQFVLLCLCVLVVYLQFGVLTHLLPAGGTAQVLDSRLDSLPFVDQFPIKGLQNKERLFPFTATRNQTFAIVEILDTWQRASRRAKVS